MGMAAKMKQGVTFMPPPFGNYSASSTSTPTRTDLTQASLVPSSLQESSQGKAAFSDVKEGAGSFKPLPSLQGANISYKTTTTTSTTTTSQLIVVDGGGSSSGSSSSSGINNGFMVGGIACAWAVIACCAIGFFILKKKYKVKKKPTKGSHASEYERLYTNSEFDQQSFMKGDSRRVPDTSRDMEAQYMPVNPDPASQYTGHQYSARHTDAVVSAPVVKENLPPAPPPVPTGAFQNPQAAPGYVPQPPFANSYMSQVSPLAPTATTMSPAPTMPNGLMGIGLPPIRYG